MAGAHVPSEVILQLVARALNTERGIKIPFSTPGAATHWRQRYYKVRAKVLKDDPTSEWRTLSSIIDPENPNNVLLIPTDSQINLMEVTEL
jgi:hypothetical protein